MPKSKSKLDLNISREVTQRIISHLGVLLHAHSSGGRSGSTWTPSNDDISIDYLLSTWLSKYVDENTDPPNERRTRAIVKWLAVERRNSRTNERLFSTDPSFMLHARNGERACGWLFLEKAAHYIREVLGSHPSEEIFLRGSFSGGATTSRKRGPETLVSKFMGRIDVTPDCQDHFVEAVNHFQAWTLYEPEVLNPRLVKGNVLFTVPKTTVIDRVACKEPDGNIFCQKAIGDFIRRRLKSRAKIDLNDQSINRSLAREGSITGGLATIDLSSASDSLTIGLVSVLLPKDWYDLLSDLRSPKTFIDGRSHVNEMFSSMGNGFTFELESLVFWALARATAYFSRVSSKKISVYGDDIIVPSSIARTLIQLLSWCGFKTNVDKTFFKGYFRESCGGHYYAGLDVTPFYLRRPLKDVSDLILFLNQYRAWLIRTGTDTLGLYDWSQRNDFVNFWYELARKVPKSLWGGYDLESRTQLVSQGPQRCELLEKKTRKPGLERKYQVGMYLSRLSEYDRRDPTHVGTLSAFSSLSAYAGNYAIRRCRFEPAVFGAVRPLFTCEL